jgi:hypothetical protein
MFANARYPMDIRVEGIPLLKDARRSLDEIRSSALGVVDFDWSVLLVG